MSYNNYDNFEIVSIQSFNITDWKDRVKLNQKVDGRFTHIHVRKMYYKTDTTGLRNLALYINNIDCNIQVHQDLLGESANFSVCDMFLSTSANADCYLENPYPPIRLKTSLNKLTQIEHEIYIDNNVSHAGITALNPVFVQIAFLREI